LAPGLTNWYVSQIFSTGKDELVLEYRNKGEIQQVILQWQEHEMFVRTDLPYRNFGRKCIAGFKELENEQVISLSQLPYERMICIEFSGGKKALIKGFGKYANFLMFENDICTKVFRHNLKSDLGKPYSDYVIDLFAEYECIKDLDSLKSFIPQLFNGYKWLVPSDFFALDKSLQVETLKNELIEGQKLYLTVANGSFAFTIEPTDLMRVAEIFLVEARKQKQFNQAQQSLKQKSKRFKNYLKKSEKELLDLRAAKGYKELGDLILSNLHLMEAGQKKAVVWDYYDNKELEIKLNPLISPQQNAQRLYRKGKNQHLQIEELERKIETAKEGIEKSNADLIKLEETGYLNSKKETKNTNDKNQASPYKLVFIDGMEVWVGKSAKGNDDMLRLARKQDTWMHARGYTGSHVIIRNNGTKVSMELLAKAGQLAVANSKAKTQSLVPVIYTERKFISKPKNAAPGAVKVQKEFVIDIVNEFNHN
jgi:predicted ribosome quality control (RQC) complex YloA/Tae2 family protein